VRLRLRFRSRERIGDKLLEIQSDFLKNGLRRRVLVDAVRSQRPICRLIWSIAKVRLSL